MNATGHHDESCRRDIIDMHFLEGEDIDAEVAEPGFMHGELPLVECCHGVMYWILPTELVPSVHIRIYGPEALR